MGYESDTSNLDIFDFSDDKLKKVVRKKRLPLRVSPYSYKRIPQHKDCYNASKHKSGLDSHCFYNMTGNEIMTYGAHDSFTYPCSPNHSPTRLPEPKSFDNKIGNLVSDTKMIHFPSKVTKLMSFYNMSGTSIMKHDADVSIDMSENCNFSTPCKEQCFFNMTGSGIMSYDSDSSYYCPHRANNISKQIYPGSSPDIDFFGNDMNQNKSAEEVPTNISALSNTRETPPPRLTFQRRRMSRGTPKQCSTPLKRNESQNERVARYDAYNAGDNVCQGIGENSRHTPIRHLKSSNLSGDSLVQPFETPDKFIQQGELDKISHSDLSRKCVSFTAGDNYITDEKAEMNSSKIAKHKTTPEKDICPLSKVTDSIKVTRHRMLTSNDNYFQDKGVQVSMMAEETYARKLVENQIHTAFYQVLPSLKKFKSDNTEENGKGESERHTETEKNVQQSIIESQYVMKQPCLKNEIYIPDIKDKNQAQYFDEKNEGSRTDENTVQQQRKLMSFSLLSASLRAKLLQRKTSKRITIPDTTVNEKSIMENTTIYPDKFMEEFDSMNKTNDSLTYFEYLYNKSRVPRFVKYVEYKYGLFKDGHIGLYHSLKMKHESRTSDNNLLGSKVHEPGDKGDMKDHSVHELSLGSSVMPRKRWWMRKKSKSFSGIGTQNSTKTAQKRKSAELESAHKISKNQTDHKKMKSPLKKQRRHSFFKHLSFRRRHHSSREKLEMFKQADNTVVMVDKIDTKTCLQGFENKPFDDQPTTCDDQPTNCASHDSSLISLPVPDNSEVQTLLQSDEMGKWICGESYTIDNAPLIIRDSIREIASETIILEDISKSKSDYELKIQNTNSCTSAEKSDIQGAQSFATNYLEASKPKNESDNKSKESGIEEEKCDNLTHPNNIADQFINEMKDAYNHLRSSDGNADEVLDLFRNYSNDDKILNNDEHTQPRCPQYSDDLCGEYEMSNDNSDSEEKSDCSEVSPLQQASQVSPGQVHLGFEKNQNQLHDRAGCYLVAENGSDTAGYSDDEIEYEGQSPVAVDFCCSDRSSTSDCLDNIDIDSAKHGASAHSIKSEESENLTLSTPESLHFDNFKHLISVTDEHAPMYYSLTSGDISPSTSASYDSSHEEGSSAITKLLNF